MSPKLEVIPDGDWPRRVAERFASFVARTPDARICLPTGDTVVRLYSTIAEIVDFGGLTVFLLDEFGGLPENDPGRCQSMIERHLLRMVRERPKLHLPPVDPPEPARYEALVDDGGLDLALVGLGPNGHIGMNEPGSRVDSPTRVVELARTTREQATGYGATEPPTWGVTLGLRPLLEAREIWLLVTGAHKRGILHRTLEGPIGSDVPATFLRRHPNLVVYADESAAG